MTWVIVFVICAVFAVPIAMSAAMLIGAIRTRDWRHGVFALVLLVLFGLPPASAVDHALRGEPLPRSVSGGRM